MSIDIMNPKPDQSKKREIKFRAWDGEKWWQVVEIQLVDQDSDLVAQFGPHLEYVVHCRDKDGNRFTGSASDTPIVRYTGLKDKNGVEIYEGDIVKMPADLWIGKESVGKAKGTFRSDVFVEYVGGSFRLNKPGDDSDNYYGVINYSINSKAAVLEVIGNIYTAMENMNGRIAELEGETENNGGGE